MSRPRILVWSHTRPSRAWRIAERISSEIPHAEICGVIQHDLRQLPRIQRLIAAGNTDWNDLQSRVPSTASLRFCKILGELVHWAVWCVHGCPRGVHAKKRFTATDLAERCRQVGWPLLVAGCDSDTSIKEFARRQKPDLVITLGQPSLSRELLDMPLLGLVRVVVHDRGDGNPTQLQEATGLTVEHFAQRSGSACTLAALSLPSQTHDGLLGTTLKSDLIADDLLLQAAKILVTRSQERTPEEVKEWIRKTLSPYLDQFNSPLRKSNGTQVAPFRQRHRSIVKLCAQSLLCLPWVISRNLYRRLRGRYPVLILTHHLISDRPHRMGMPTEDFWRRIRFLQRHYRIVSLSEADELLHSGNVTAPAVVLTFDDGYCDNFIGLRAAAEETGAKIAMFVATQQIELHQEFQHDLAAGTRRFFPLTWEQIRHWRSQGVEFASHTRTHFDCGSSDRSRLEPEIEGSKDDLETRLGQPVNSFAFPFGKRANMSSEAMHMAASTYSLFLSSFGGENLPQKRSRRQHLLRKSLYSDPWELELELQSVFDLVQSSRSMVKRPLSSFHAEPVTAKS